MKNSEVSILFHSFDLSILNNFSVFENFINNNKNIIIQAKGKNKQQKCPFKKFCYKNGKKFIIEQIISVEPYHTRFPLLKKIINKLPFLLQLIPTKLYDKFYSFCWDNLGCPYQSYLIPQNIEKIKFVYEHLSDEKSKKSFLASLMTRITHDFSYINHIQETLPVYFIEGFSNLKDEFFVDCGAFTGDTFEDFLKYNSTPKRYYFYEMDNSRLKRIEQTVKKYGAIELAKIRPYGVSDKSGNATFTEKGMGSFIEDSKKDNSIKSVQIITLDEDISEPISFIKMDIEGFEIAALKGATKIINKFKPKLAISSYHRLSDLWEIPYFIINSFIEYKEFYFRQHKKNAIDDAVFYAK